MIYDGELNIVCSTFEKCRVRAYSFCEKDEISHTADEKFTLLFGKDLEPSAKYFFDRTAPRTVFRLRTSFALSYIMLQLPATAEKTVLLIGPYLSTPHDSIPIFEISEKYGFPPRLHKLLQDYYHNITYLPESSHLFIMLDAFSERIWGNGNYSVIDIDDNFLQTDNTSATYGPDEDILVTMKIMEERYEAENALMRAISTGQTQGGASLISSFDSMPFEKRLDDPIRNLKNYCIIMNTLFRKAAEMGDIHPIYLNEISSVFAEKIEQADSVSGIKTLMSEMYRAYCQLVKKHKTGSHSPLVQKTKLIIGSDLSSDLSLSKLAAAQNINPSYLSTLFKKETGRTVTDYILSERMDLAVKLLETTRLQIQTVALHCGILDVQYFSKLFKKHTGMPPKEYRLKFKSKNYTKTGEKTLDKTF